MHASLEIGVATYCSNWSCYKGWENLLSAQTVYEHCSSHDKYHCKGTMPFAAYSTYLTSK